MKWQTGQYDTGVKPKQLTVSPVLSFSLLFGGFFSKHSLFIYFGVFDEQCARSKHWSLFGQCVRYTVILLCVWAHLYMSENFMASRMFCGIVTTHTYCSRVFCLFRFKFRSLSLDDSSLVLLNRQHYSCWSLSFRSKHGKKAKKKSTGCYLLLSPNPESPSITALPVGSDTPQPSVNLNLAFPPCSTVGSVALSPGVWSVGRS